MGYGDELMGSGMARLSAESGKRAAIGDGHRVIWHRNAYEIFRNNPHVVRPEENIDDADAQVDFIEHCAGKRAYCRLSPGRRWSFNRSFRPTPGQLFFDAAELRAADRVPRDLVVVEPNIKRQASPNKQWPHERYQRVVHALADKGYRVAQFATDGVALDRAEQIGADSFRVAAAILQRSALYIGAEGGLHHASAAVGTKAVVLFGAFIAPQVTGYDGHENIFTGEDLGCGKLDLCPHCMAAMQKITVEEVVEKSLRLLAA